MGKWQPMSRLANLFLVGLMGMMPDLALENTNIIGYEDSHYTVDYNRLRADLALEHEKCSNFAARLIVDNESLYTTRPSGLQNKTSIYRAYLQYRGVKHFWSVGKQRIPLGVGRIWNPIDVFNPIDVETIETEERIGTESIRYEYALAELSGLNVTVARDRGAVELKGYLKYADVGLVALWDEDADPYPVDLQLPESRIGPVVTGFARDIIGWEIEGELAGTGMELRSEGGSFHDRENGDRHTEFTVGAEYGFADSLTLLGEYYYSGQPAGNHFGAQASYKPGMLWTCSLLLIANLADQSGFIAPVIEYSLSDEMTLTAGAFLYNGGDGDEFGQVDNRCYLRWFIHF